METYISSVARASSLDDGVYYPDTDGQPMANNTEHFERIATTKYGLESVFRGRDDVFVAADLFWYPVKDKPNIAVAPDVMVVFGRPKGERKSYIQWREDNVAPQVVFEFLSEANTAAEMARKAAFFERYGVQEYYIYDLNRKELSGLLRYDEQGDALEEIPDMRNWKSPRLGVRFDMSSGDLQIYKPDDTPFLQFSALEDLVRMQTAELKQTAEKIEQISERLERAEVAISKSESRAEALAAKLRALGVDPDAA